MYLGNTSLAWNETAKIDVSVVSTTQQSRGILPYSSVQNGLPEEVGHVRSNAYLHNVFIFCFYFCTKQVVFRVGLQSSRKPLWCDSYLDDNVFSRLASTGE